MKFLLCTVTTHFCAVQDQSMCKVDKPIQIFDTFDEAMAAQDLFAPFYDYELRVVDSLHLGSTFR